MSKSLNVNLSFKGLGGKLKNYLGVIFVLVLLGLFLAEGLVLKHSWDLIMEFKPAEEVVPNKGVRVNFTNYDAVTKIIDDAKVYQSPGDHIKNPFNQPNAAQ